MTADNRVRLDKWLWAARFFKTRSLAADAVSGGKVHVSGNRAKPAHGVKIGEILSIRRDSTNISWRSEAYPRNGVQLARRFNYMKKPSRVSKKGKP
jgi:ribosomal 50S subunit-recycling heat shock protein